ncbi:MAG: U32 family peptidase [Ruminococcaceae bacterium]|nr:U32 family peptidase [Oscillospiraceae bacterium]
MITEVLSPVGNMEMLYAAVRAGADAVYLGAKEFNARRNANNFDLSQLKEAIDYCHIRSVKVYLTLNVLIKDEEMDKALSLAFEAYRFGIDGIIIADLGLSALLKEKLPNLPLHASTQMTVCHEDSLPILKKLGFTRVVAAREMSKKELIQLCNKARELDMEVEVFVHGALCMCMSGQCLMSALIGSRSGNRGLCAGPCRLPFDNKSDNEYALSLKDLSLLDHIDELKEMGIASLKIEGRMKRPEYVAAVTAAARSMVDTGKIDEKLKDCVKSVFSRSGFTDGYFTDKTGKDMFGMRTKDDVISVSDALPFLHEIIRRERQSIPLSISAIIKENLPIKIILDDGTHKAEVSGEIPEKAVRVALTEEGVISSLSKLGSTPYFAEKVSVDLDNNLSVRTSVLNELRRKACAELDKKRIFIRNDGILPKATPIDFIRNYPTPEIWIKLSSLSQLPNRLDGVSKIILPLEDEFDLNLLPKNTPIAVDISGAGFFGEKLSEKLKKAKEQGFSAVFVNNIAHIGAALSSGMEVFAGHRLNIFSNFSMLYAKNLNFSGAVISPELTEKALSDINPYIKKICFAYGKLPLMLTKNCPVCVPDCKGCKKDRYLTDRKGVKFPVKCRTGYSEIFADRPVFIADKIEDFEANAFLLYFTDETREETEKIIKTYVNGEKADSPFTRGLYYRGVE